MRTPADPRPEQEDPVVYLVDDDPGIRSAIARLLRVAGLQTEAYSSGTAFLAAADLNHRGCLLLDLHMPGMSGLEVQASLKQRRSALPVIFLTAAADIPIAVAAMREGAVDFIEKPFENAHLLTRVQQAIERSLDDMRRALERNRTLHRLETLTPREHEVLELVVSGMTAKEIARKLGASHRTIEIHRGHIMEKMAAASLADLVRMRLLAQDPDI
ncbi:MAG: response regulator transcription factor [Rudaea sp.]